jgi:2-polyprenyl-3-methyl-5-hydroxy-6-metoxy-1,4-benzoquinol methylase
MTVQPSGHSPYDLPVDEQAAGTAHRHALDLVGHNRRVFELGCATGQFTRVLAARGCSVVGIEVDAAAARLAEPHAEEVLVADLDVDDWVAKLSGRTFDVVLLGDVLEHLRDPLALLRATRPLLAPGGYVVVSLPNVAHVDLRLSLLAGRFDYRDSGLLDRTHLRFFTRASAERLLLEAGFVALELRRVSIPAFAGELGVDPAEVPEGVLDAVRVDPESETYQFVFRAVPDDGDAALAALAARACAAEDALHAAHLEEARLRERAEVSERAAREATDAAAEAVAELAAMRGTRLFRYARGPRELYRRVRRLP